MRLNKWWQIIHVWVIIYWKISFPIVHIQTITLYSLQKNTKTNETSWQWCQIWHCASTQPECECIISALQWSGRLSDIDLNFHLFLAIKMLWFRRLKHSALVVLPTFVVLFVHIYRPIFYQFNTIGIPIIYELTAWKRSVVV